MRMHWFLLIAAMLPAARLDAQEEKPRGKNEQQIPQIKLDRKSPVIYEKEVEPILVNKCAFCHSGNIKEGKFDLSSYDNMMRGGKRGPAVVPGKSAESFLVKISAKDIRPFMPPRSEEALTPQELAVIRLWIDQGAKPPTGARAVAKVVVKLPPASVHPILGVAVSPDAKMVASSRGNQIHLYETTTGKHVRTMKDPAVVGSNGKPVTAAHVSLVETLAFSPDGKTLASGSFQEVKLWDVATGQVKALIPGFAERVLTLCFSHNGKYLACGGGAPSQEGELKLVDPASGKVVRDIKENLHSDTVFSVAFSPDDKLLVSSGADKFVKTFEADTGKFQKAFEGHTHHVLGVGFSADGKMIASAGADNVVKIWDYAKGEQVRTINAHGKQISALVFIGKTPTFATCAGDQQVRIWDTNGGNVRNYTAGNDYLQCVAASPDGAVVAAGGQEGVLHLYNGKTGALIKDILPPGVEKPAAPAKKN